MMKSMSWKIGVIILASNLQCTLIWLRGGEDDCIMAWPQLWRSRRLGDDASYYFLLAENREALIWLNYTRLY